MLVSAVIEELPACESSILSGGCYTSVAPLEDSRMKNLVDWVSCLAGPLCLLPLLVPWVLKWGSPGSSFHVFVARELFVFVFCVLAIVFSGWGFGERPFNLKFLNVTTAVLAFILWLLGSWGML